MTILFVTAQDYQTQANLTIAQKIAANTDQPLFGASANRAMLLNLVLNPQHDRTVFSMSHGSRTAVIGHDDSPALHEGDGNALYGFSVFAWACHTGATLGHSLAQAGVTWWGYDCAVTAPDSRIQFQDIFANVFGVVKCKFVSGVDVNSVNNALMDIQLACDTALKELDSCQAFNDVDAFSLYSCCNQLWRSLSVWLAGSKDPCRHPDAPPAFILI